MSLVIVATQLMGILHLQMFNWILHRVLESLKMAGFLLFAFGGFVFVVAITWSVVTGWTD